jgi:hypothetical protein
MITNWIRWREKNYAQEKPDVLNELKVIIARHPQVKPQVRKYMK